VSRTDPAFLAEYARAVHEAGATRLRLSDSVGGALPEQIAGLVRSVAAAAPIDVQLHMHNDFGLALANVLAGLRSGATMVHVTVNGLGDRAGIASLHQVAAALELLLDIPTGIDLTALPEVSRLVAELSGTMPALNEPIIGEVVFTHESGIHVDGLLKAPDSFALLDPSRVGRAHSFVLGKHSGSQALQHVLSGAGVAVDRDDARQLLPLVRELAVICGGSVPAEAAATIARHVAAQRGVATPALSA
jgi:homocitrate synthase NifV